MSQEWTEPTALSPSPDAMTPRKWPPHISQWVGWGSATLLVVAAFLPWESIPINPVDISFNGVATDGILTLIRGLIFAALVIAFPRRWAAICGLLLGVLILAVSVGDTSAVFVPLKIGVGLVLTDVAAVGCIFASLIAASRRRTPARVLAQSGITPQAN
jgi:hypothetical protein